MEAFGVEAGSPRLGESQQERPDAPNASSITPLGRDVLEALLRPPIDEQDG